MWFVVTSLHPSVGEAKQAPHWQVGLYLCFLLCCVCVCTQVVVYKGATRGDGYMNLEAADLSVEAKVQRVRVTVVFNFLNRMKVCLSVGSSACLYILSTCLSVRLFVCLSVR